MEKYPIHNLASICQRMPLDVFVVTTVKVADKTIEVPIRAVKSQLVDTLREMDGRVKVSAELTLNSINLKF